MIFSMQSLLSNRQAVTGTTMSTNIIDFGKTATPFGAAAALNCDLGWGNKIPLLVQVTEDFNNLTSLTVEIMCDDNETPTTVVASTTVAASSLVAGYQAALDVIPQNCKGRYFAVKYVVAGTAPTTGTIIAGITMGNQQNVTGA